MKRTSSIGMLGASFAALVAAAAMTPAAAQQIAIDADDIGGVVTGAKGPEAGVWVIAETRDLPTKYVKIVVTDDRGRYVLPDLPTGDLRHLGPRLWPRGFAEGEGRSPARPSTSSRCKRRTAPPPLSTIRASSGTR